MKKDFVYIIIIGIFALLLFTERCDADRIQNELKREVLKKDKLIEVSNGQYRKLVADTIKSRKEFNKIITDLKYKLDNVEPKILIKEVEVIVKEYEEIPTEVVDSIITAYYPTKEDYFVRYTGDIKNKNSKFVWKSIKLSVLLSENKNGIWQADIKTPSFMEVVDVDIVSRPLKKEKGKHNSTWSLYVGASHDIRQEKYLPQLTVGILNNNLMLNTDFNSIGASWRIK